VTPQPEHSAPPNTVCDFEHQCYPEKGGPTAPAPVAPPAMVVKPIAPRPPAANSTPDDPVVTAWRDCMGQALQNYEQSHNLHALQVTTTNCQVRLEEQGGEDYAGAEPPAPLAAPQANGRRNIGCGWWPIGSDADRDCAAGGAPLLTTASGRPPNYELRGRGLQRALHVDSGGSAGCADPLSVASMAAE
jgi:hypothetical protein